MQSLDTTTAGQGRREIKGNEHLFPEFQKWDLTTGFSLVSLSGHSIYLCEESLTLLYRVQSAYCQLTGC